MKKIITKPAAIIILLILTLTLAMPMTAEAKSAPKLNKKKVTLTITKKKTKPSYKLKVKNAAGKRVKWTTSNKKVATVNKSGKVTAKAKGSAVITAKVGKKKLTCKVTVKDTRKNSDDDDDGNDPVSNNGNDNTCINGTKHVYKDHWAVFNRYYEIPEKPEGSVFGGGSCYSGFFSSEKEWKQHSFEMAFSLGCKTGYEQFIGLHGKKSRYYSGPYMYDGKQYRHIVTRYVDYATCTKCGFVLTTWDNENDEEYDNHGVHDPAVEPLGGGEPIDDIVKRLEEKQKNL